MTGTLGTIGNVRATTSHTSGKWHFEVTMGGATSGNYPIVGIANVSASLTSDLGSDSNSIEYQRNGAVWFNNTVVGSPPSYAAGDVIAVEVDFDNKLFYVQKAGAARSAGISFSSMSGPYFPAFGGKFSNDSAAANFGASAFAITPTAGFSAWNAG